MPLRNDMGEEGDRVRTGDESDDAAGASSMQGQREHPTPGVTSEGNRNSRRTPMGYKLRKEVKSDNLSPVKSVLDVAKIRDETHVKVQFVDGSVIWVPLIYLNDAAQKKLVSPDVSIREMPNLRPKRK